MSTETKETDAVRVELIASRTAHAELFSAFEYGEILTFRLFLPEELRKGPAVLRMTRDDDGKILRFSGEKSGAFYRFVVETDAICREDRGFGLFFYDFIVGSAIVGGGACSCAVFTEDGPGHPRFQLSVYAEGTNRKTGYEGGIMYQIFPDRFFCAGEPISKDYAVMEPDWNAPVSEYSRPGVKLFNNHFYGGNLRGIVEKLDRLKELGVTILYLNPIFRAFSNHRYDVGSYEEVDPVLGGNEALDLLISEAKKRGISILLDGVFNHTGSDSLYFNKNGRYDSVGAYQSKDSPYAGWYCFKEFPDDYESWWGFETLPKLNTLDPTCREYLTGEDGIIARYIKKGIAGWRLDVVDELKNDTVNDIRRAARRADPRALVYGEVWEDASNKVAYSERRSYFVAGQLDGVMNYPLKNAIAAYLLDRDASFLFATVKTLYSHYPKAVSDMQMNVLGTHDTERILTVLAGSPEGWRDNEALAHAKLSAAQRAIAKKRLKLAVLMQMTLPGIPCIYYGDEAGMEGYKDPFNRQPYPWGREDAEVLAHYKRMTALRTSLPMLADAYYRGVSCSNGVFVYERFNDDETLTVTVNLSDDDLAPELPAGAKVLYAPDGFDGSSVLRDGEALITYRKEED